MKCLCFDAQSQCGVVPVYLCVCGSPNYTMERKSFLYQSFPLAFVQSVALLRVKGFRTGIDSTS